MSNPNGGCEGGGKVLDIKLIQGECLEEMAKLPDGCVDMVMCDLPYGTTQNKWDTCIDLTKLWALYKRICKGAVVLTAAQPFTSVLVMSNLREFKYQWVWDKVRPVGHLVAKKRPMARHEDVVVFGASMYIPQMELRDRPIRGKEGKRSESCTGTSVGFESLYTHKYPQSILSVSKDEKGIKLHPTQKPVALMEYLIRTYTNEGMVVLDNCMGSGTTGVACVNTNRNFIGIEMDANYFTIAEKRITEAKNGLRAIV